MYTSVYMCRYMWLSIYDNLIYINGASLVAQRLKHLLAMWEMVQSLGREDTLEKEMATHSSTLAWRIPWTEEPGRLQSTGSQRVRHDWATSLSLSLYIYIKVAANLCPTLCNLMGYSMPHSSVHLISQARILEWVAICFYRGSSWPRNQTHISCIGRQILYCWTTSKRSSHCTNVYKCLSFMRFVFLNSVTPESSKGLKSIRW